MIKKHIYIAEYLLLLSCKAKFHDSRIFATCVSQSEGPKKWHSITQVWLEILMSRTMSGSTKLQTQWFTFSEGHPLVPILSGGLMLLPVHEHIFKKIQWTGSTIQTCLKTGEKGRTAVPWDNRYPRVLNTNVTVRQNNTGQWSSQYAAVNIVLLLNMKGLTLLWTQS
jgi:hypothetical protein